MAQWGNAEGEIKVRARQLPDDLETVCEDEYVARRSQPPPCPAKVADPGMCFGSSEHLLSSPPAPDSYGASGFTNGCAVSANNSEMWPVHCYGMVGVARNLSPDTGTGAELYAVIGHAPRHLDRNIALIGRVVEGIEHLSSLPRGPGNGVYADRSLRTPILTVRLGNEVPGLPGYEYLSTESAAFARYADARANRRDPFFIVAAAGADICNIPVPVRRVKW